MKPLVVYVLVLWLASICLLLGETENKLYPYCENKPGDKEKKWGFCDVDGNLKYSGQYKSVNLPSDGFSVVKLESNKSALVKNGEKQFTLDFDEIHRFSEQMAAIRKNGQWGYLDRDLNIKIPPEYDDARRFSNGLASVKKAGKWGYINSKNERVIDFIYDQTQKFSDGLAVVKKNNRYGAIDAKGQVVIPFEYKRLGTFADGLLPASRDGKNWIFIDSLNKPQLQHEYQFAFPFVDGHAVVQNKKGFYGMINKTGKTVIPFEFAALSNFSGNVAAYGIGHSPGDIRYGFMNKSGKILTKPVFTDAQPIDNGVFFIARKKSKLKDQYGYMYFPEDYLFAKVLPDGKIIFFEKSR